jgi:hypothetical protein
MHGSTRRTVLVGAVAAALDRALAQQPAASAAMLVHKDPGCGCCSAWVEHVRAAGFRTEVIDTADLAPLKARLGILPHLAACHTAEIAGYVIEGHVPASAVARLLSERPTAVGLAVPGMPIGSPGMEVPGSPDERYEVILFGPSGERTYARFHGRREL